MVLRGIAEYKIRHCVCIAGYAVVDIVAISHFCLCKLFLYDGLWRREKATALHSDVLVVNVRAD